MEAICSVDDFALDVKYNRDGGQPIAIVHVSHILHCILKLLSVYLRVINRTTI